MDWKAELFKRLDAIGEKLGVAANHLWAVLVRQGITTGVADAFVAVILLGMCLWLWKVARKCWNTKSGDDAYLWSSIWSHVGSIAFAVVALVFSYYAIIELGNPEYFALHKILESLK